MSESSSAVPSVGPETKKVVINTCYGGFSLSPLAVKRMAELRGRECYFFAHPEGGPTAIDLHSYVPVSVEEAGRRFIFHAYDIPDADTRLKYDRDRWYEMSLEERQAHNALSEKHTIDNRPSRRDDPALVQVVEELGKAANGSHAELSIVEIPADVEYVIEEYDGTEWIAEAHRTWR